MNGIGQSAVYQTKGKTMNYSGLSNAPTGNYDNYDGD
jgi:hypothetical protein